MHLFQSTSLIFMWMILIISSMQAGSQNLCPIMSDTLNCMCTIEKTKCSGIQSDAREMTEIFANFSSSSDVEIRVNNLHFEPGFKLENTGIKNLTLGYGLESLSQDFFSELGPTLIALNLNNNSISYIADQLFSSLSNLSSLHLDLNEISEIEPSMFANLSSLKYLSIASNVLSEIHEESFAGLMSLDTLVLSHNNLSDFNNANIKSQSLVVLKLDGCLIYGSISRDTLSNVPNLQELDLSHNKISEVKSHSLASLKALKSLNLSFNEVEYLQENSFFELSNLTVLDLKVNKISLVKISSFTGLLNLKYLDLSKNRLKAFLCEYTADFTMLEIINLEDNELKTFTLGAFYYSPLLKELKLTGNNLECSCELTDMAHYLTENSTLEKKDLESVYCIITTTLGYMPITEYKNSKCIPGEPCKKVSHLTNEDDYIYYDYFDESTTLSTTVGTSTMSVDTSTTTLSLSSSPMTSDPETSSNEILGTSLYSESSSLTQTASPLENSTNDGIITSGYSSTYHETVSAFETSSNAVTNDFEAAYSTVDEITTELSSILHLSTQSTTESSVFSTTETFSTIDALTTSSTDFVSSTVKETTVPTDTLTSSLTSNVCDHLKLSFDKSTLGIETGITQNFTFDGSTFCLKWTLGAPLPPKSRCIIKYTFIRGIKSENLKCPQFLGDVKLWSKNEKIYKFCLNIYGASIGGSCTKVTNKTESSTTKISTLNLTASMSTNIITNKILTDPVETTTFAADTETVTSTQSVLEKTSTFETQDTEITTVSAVPPSFRFNITSFEVFFNDSSFAYAKWSVMKEDPSKICNLTLTVTTQYFDHNEGVFPCRHHTHKLQNVREDDIFKLCLVIDHEINGYNTICRYSLVGANVDVEASSQDKSANHSSSLIPLLCLFAILMLIIIVIVFRNIFKKRQESERYDVKAEEERANRVQIRPSSTSDRSFMRSSYIAKDDVDI